MPAFSPLQTGKRGKWLTGSFLPIIVTASVRSRLSAGGYFSIGDRTPAILTNQASADGLGLHAQRLEYWSEPL
jgi:hypothetical protein